MGRHFCKLCSSSHDLPAIQPRGGKGFSLSASRTLQICASHTSPTLFLADVPDLPGHSLKLTVSDADFSCQHQVSTLALEIPLGGLKCGGHWSLVFEAFEGRSKDGRQDKGRGLRSGKHMVVKVYKEQGSQTQGQIFDRFHRVRDDPLPSHRCTVHSTSNCLGDIKFISSPACQAAMRVLPDEQHAGANCLGHT